MVGLNQTQRSTMSTMQASRESALQLRPGVEDDPLESLRTMADRVGTKVEKFAEYVDSWHTHIHEDENNAKARYESTLVLVADFQEYTDAEVETLMEENGEENQEVLAKSLRRRLRSLADTPRRSIEVEHDGSDLALSQHGEATSSAVRDLRQAQAEAATWELLQVIIHLYHPEPETDPEAERRERIEEIGTINQYTQGAAIWDRFILDDSKAKEKYLILKWLQSAADSNESNIQTITEQLQAESRKDVNSWTNGWLETREKVKEAKRMRGTALNADLPQIPNKDRTQVLVNQLDPDAPGRQRRTLEKSDDYYERAVWMTIYEMLRRGTPLQDIRDWCSERNESWRAVSMGLSSDQDFERWTCLSGPNLGFLWRRMCFLQARGAQYRYENAVYGLLSGDLKQVESVCRTWDDHLYARYNSLLLSRFDSYLQKHYPTRVPATLAQKFPSYDAVAALGSWAHSNQQVINSLKDQKGIAAQAKSPLKLIQGSLIAGTLKELVDHVGIAISQITRDDERPEKLSYSTDATTDECYKAIATDPHALGMLVHLLIIFRRGLNVMRIPKSSDEKRLIENIITQYIEWLRLNGKIDAIPIYAAQLSRKRRHHCLARILPGIKHASEQKEFVQQLLVLKIELVHCISEYWEVAFRANPSNDEHAHIDRYQILERNEEYLWPGQRVRDNFLDDTISPEDEALIEPLQWYNHLTDERGSTFMALTETLKHFLQNGRIGPAIKIANEMSVEAVSMIKTRAYCGYPFDFTLPGAEVQDKAAIKRTKKSLPAGTQFTHEPTEEEHRVQVYQFRAISKTYSELCQLVRALELLQEWRGEERKLIQTKDQGGKVSTKRVKDIFIQLEATMEYLLDDTLTHGTDDAQAQQLLWIRRAYFPEIIIAYNSVIQAFACFTGREIVTKSMDLATVIASEDHAELADAFVQTGRMEELMDAFAATSKTMLMLNADDKKRSTKKRGWKGESAKIWDVNVRN